VNLVELVRLGIAVPTYGWVSMYITYGSISRLSIVCTEVSLKAVLWCFYVGFMSVLGVVQIDLGK